MPYCARCQGILAEKQTILPGDKEGESMHYSCAYNAWIERQEKLRKGGDDADQIRRASWPFNTLPPKRT